SLIWSMSVFSLTTTIGPLAVAELVDGARPAASTASKQLSRARRQLKRRLLSSQRRDTSPILLRRLCGLVSRARCAGSLVLPCALAHAWSGGCARRPRRGHKTPAPPDRGGLRGNGA